MKYTFLFALLLSLDLSAQIKPILFQVKSDTILKWNYHFGDEFIGAQVDQSKWYPRYPWGGLLLDQSQWAVPEMLSQKNGWLHLGAKEFHQKTQVPNWMINQQQAADLGLNIKNDSVYLDYLTSCIWSIDTFRYGYFECRAVVPQGKGLWPAFWLFGQNGKDEIDIMECKGERTKDVHVDIHLPERKDYVKNKIGIKKDWGGWVRMQSPIVNDTVIYSGVWLPNSLTYFVNGIPVSHFDGDFSTPMNVIINLAVARDDYPFNPGPDAKTKFPADYQVDYVRVWKLDEVPSKNNFQISLEEKIDVLAVPNGQKVKKKVPHIYPKKQLHREQGFISFIPISASKYCVQVNGISEPNSTIWVNGIQQENRLVLDLGKANKATVVKIELEGKTFEFCPFQ